MGGENPHLLLNPHLLCSLGSLDDHTGGCGRTRVTGSRGLPPLPGHETVSQSPLAPTSVLTISNELYWIKRIPKFDVRVL